MAKHQQREQLKNAIVDLIGPLDQFKEVGTPPHLDMRSQKCYVEHKMQMLSPSLEAIKQAVEERYMKTNANQESYIEFEGNLFVPTTTMTPLQAEIGEKQVRESARKVLEPFFSDEPHVVASAMKKASHDLAVKILPTNEKRPGLAGAHATFATRSFSNGEPITPYAGRVLTYTEYERAKAVTLEEIEKGTYLFELAPDAHRLGDLLKDTIYFDPFPIFGNESMFINDYRVDPFHKYFTKTLQRQSKGEENINCAFTTIFYKGWPYIFITAIADIVNEEELIIDYGKPYWATLRNKRDVTLSVEVVSRLKKLRTIYRSNLEAEQSLVAIGVQIEAGRMEIDRQVVTHEQYYMEERIKATTYLLVNGALCHGIITLPDTLREMEVFVPEDYQFPCFKNAPRSLKALHISCYTMHPTYFNLAMFINGNNVRELSIHADRIWFGNNIDFSNILHLCVDYSNDLDLTCFQKLESLTYVDSSAYGVKILLPSGLKTLNFEGGQLPQVPENLRFLNYVSCIEDMTTMSTLPDSLQELQLTSFGPISIKTLPESILRLDLAITATTPIMLPSNLKQLFIICEFSGSLPDSLEEICLDEDFDYPLGKLPDNLRKLTLNECFDFDLGVLPITLRYLKIGSLYSKDIKLSDSDSVKSIDIWGDERIAMGEKVLRIIRG